jgi:hypothetical protein
VAFTLYCKVLYNSALVQLTSSWRNVLAVVVMVIGAAIAIPLGQYADRDDAPGGVVIAFLLFVGAAVLAIWIVKERPNSSARSEPR